MNPTLKVEDYAVLAAKHNLTDKVILFGLRASASEFGKYDDTIAVYLPEENIVHEYKGNTMPSVSRSRIAVLQPGVYRYRQGLHGLHHLNGTSDNGILEWLNANKGRDHPTILDGLGHARLLPYWAFRQDGPVCIKRVGMKLSVSDAWPSMPAWIDIHKGGYNLTSSEGCQTCYPDFWESLRAIGFSKMDEYKQVTINYCLVQI